MSKPESLIGKQIDQFTLEAFIARGAMGMVFKAFDSVLARTVALKLIPRISREDSPDIRDGTREEARKRLIQEAKAAGKLAQPNIVTIHSYGETDEFQYICMEYISGRTLAEILKERGKIPVDEAIPILEQILLALEAADEEGIVHRDIKPSNIMITKNGQVKVMDFGIAKLPSLSMTVTGMVLGTPYYMSPEQISGKKVDIRSDIFSLGAVLYEVLTGEKPFEGESTASLTYKIIQIDPIPPNVINRLVPDPIASIVTKALAKDPSKRYQHATEMLKDLRNLSSGTSRVTDSEATVLAAFESTVLDDRLAGVRDQTAAASSSSMGTVSGSELKPEETAGTVPAGGGTVADAAEERGRQEPPDLHIRESRADGEGLHKEPVSHEAVSKQEKRSGLQFLWVLFFVIAVGGVFAFKYMNWKSRLESGKLPPQPPVTVQDTTRPEVTPPSSENQTKPTAESLLTEAKKVFTSDPERSQTLLEQALVLDPNNYSCVLAMARVLSHRKEYTAAIEEYRHALRIDNGSADVHYELGNLYLVQGEYDSAIQAFEDVLIHMPKKRDEVLAKLGFCHFKKGDFRQARLLFQQSLDLNPENATAKAFMASLPVTGTQTTTTTVPPSTQPSVTQPPSTQPPAVKPPATQPPGTTTTGPPVTQPPAKGPPSAQAPASQPAAKPSPQTGPKIQGAGIVAGQWDYSITVQGGRVVFGQLAIDSKGDQLQMISTSSYRMRGQDGLMHQFHEKNYFTGTFHGQNLVARCDKADFTVDGLPTPVPGLPLQVNLVLNPDGVTMQGAVSNSQGVTAPLQVKKR
jgi:serine/threonine-protein kinase